MYVRSTKISLSILCDVRFVFFFFFGESTYIRISILLNFIRLYFDVIIFLNFGFFFERRGGEEKKGNGIPLTAFVRCNSL